MNWSVAKKSVISSSIMVQDFWGECASVKQLITQRALELCECCLYLTDWRRAVVWCSRGSQSNFTTYCREFTEPRGIMLISSHSVTTNGRPAKKPDLGHLRYIMLQRKYDRFSDLSYENASLNSLLFTSIKERLDFLILLCSCCVYLFLVHIEGAWNHPYCLIISGMFRF